MLLLPLLLLLLFLLLFIVVVNVVNVVDAVDVVAVAIYGELVLVLLLLRIGAAGFIWLYILLPPLVQSRNRKINKSRNGC